MATAQVSMMFHVSSSSTDFRNILLKVASKQQQVHLFQDFDALLKFLMGSCGKQFNKHIIPTVGL